jgi:Rieske Fe-S protein
MPHETPAHQDPTRRGLLRGVALGSLGVPLLAACGGDGDSGSAGLSEPVTVPAADVPVGGGTILGEEKVVVTQPAEGQFKAFSAVCTHQGCPVQSISDGTIRCPCHGSEFSAEDGSVVAGPATAPLEALPVTRKGQELRVG